MLKTVFRANELIVLPEKVNIESPTSYPDLAHLAVPEETIEELNDINDYTGPTADDLRREAEMFKAGWEEEKERMFQRARAEAEKIITDARNTASLEINSKTNEGQVIKQHAEDEARRIIGDAQIRALEFEKDFRQTLENEKKEACEKGWNEGRLAGFAEGKAEVDRLIERTQVMLERAQEKRGDVLRETEQEIVDLVLLISRKVIKVISENQRNVIISNVIQALRKIKSRGDIIIRLNLNDLKLATEHKQEFINLVEGAKSINLIEDSTVDRGGCIIETDFGEIDARISSQLAELESRILEISPVKTPEKKQIPDRVPTLTVDLAASASLQEEEKKRQQEDTPGELSEKASAALTASAALAALATLGTKGKRKTDADLIITPPRFPKESDDS